MRNGGKDRCREAAEDLYGLLQSKVRRNRTSNEYSNVKKNTPIINKTSYQNNLSYPKLEPKAHLWFYGKI